MFDLGFSNREWFCFGEWAMACVLLGAATVTLGRVPVLISVLG